MIKRGPSDIEKIKGDFSIKEVQDAVEESMGFKKGKVSVKEKTKGKLL